MAEEKKKEESAKKSEKGGDKHGADKKGGEEKAAKGGLLFKTPVLLGGAMIIEAVVLFAGIKMFSSKSAPPAASAAELTTAVEEGAAAGEKGDAKSDEHGGAAKADAEHGAAEHGGEHAAAEGAAPTATKSDRKRSAELQVVDFRAPNKMSGRTFLYDVTIFAVTKGSQKERVEAAIKDHEALIKDRVRTIIAQLDPEKLGGGSEPGLETLRRQVKYQLDEIVGDGLIDEVVVPRCIPFRTDY